MSLQDGPPDLISDEWRSRDEPTTTTRNEDTSENSGASSETEGDDGDRTETTIPLPAVLDDPIEGGDIRAEPGEPEEPSLQQPEARAYPESDALALIRAELTALRAETVHVNGILDRLHSDNERLRRGESERLLQPVFRELLKLADDWITMATSWGARESATPADVAGICLAVADDARLILTRQGVDSFAPEIGDPVERRQHRVVGTVPAESPELDNTVAEVRRPGFTYGEKVIKFAEVVSARRGR